MTGLRDHHLDIIIGRPDQAGSRLQALARQVIDDGERDRARRFVFERDRELFTFAHGFLRLTLARYLDADPRALHFLQSPGGRPECLSADGGVPIRFNLSHTHGLVACAVTRAADCGMDVEGLGRVDYRDLVATVLAPSEIAELMALDEAARPESFLAYWTLKEAYVKGRGLGLAIPVIDVRFSDLNGQCHFTLGAGIEDAASDWRFWTGRPTSNHLAAAALRTRGERATFTVREFEELI